MEAAAAVTLVAVVLVIAALVVYLVAVILELRKITAGLDAVELLNTTQGQVSQTVAVVADYGGSLDTILEDT